jgi:ABC-2 type transport system permease protein
MNWKTQRVAFNTIFFREVKRFFRIWKQTLLPPVITQSLYFIIFGGFIGSQVRTIEGVPYMEFIVPGLVMMSVINASFTNVSFSFFASKFMRSIDEMLVAPVHPLTMIAGYVAGGTVRGLLTGFIVFLVSLFFAQPTIHSVTSLALFATLTAIVFSLAGIINGMYANSFDDVGTFSTFILTPLTYLGGVFYPVSALPGIWQQVSSYNPIVYMVDGFRYGVIGVQDFPLYYSTTLLIVFTAALVIFNVWMMNRGKLKN